MIKKTKVSSTVLVIQVILAIELWSQIAVIRKKRCQVRMALPWKLAEICAAWSLAL